MVHFTRNDLYTFMGGHKATTLQLTPVGATFMVAQSPNNCTEIANEQFSIINYPLSII